MTQGIHLYIFISPRTPFVPAAHALILGIYTGVWHLARGSVSL